MRKALSYILFPALMVVPMAAGYGGLSLGWPPTLVLVVCLLGSLLVLLGLERVMPYRPQWNERRQVPQDLTCLGLGALTNEVLEISVLAGLFWGATKLSAALGVTLWPTTWPFLLQLLLVILVADLGHYVAHRMLHSVPFLWRFHQMHHRPDHLYSLNFFRMHPLDIAFKGAVNFLPLVLLGAPSDVMLLWMIASGISAGSVNHSNIEIRTGWLDGIFSTPHLHRFHHSRSPEEHRANLGNITVLYDRLFGTYCCPPGRDVVDVGELGGAKPLADELLRPFGGGSAR